MPILKGSTKSVARFKVQLAKLEELATVRPATQFDLELKARKAKNMVATCALHKVMAEVSREAGIAGFELNFHKTLAIAMVAYAKLLYLPPELAVKEWDLVKRATELANPRRYEDIRRNLCDWAHANVPPPKKLTKALEELHQEIQSKLVELAKFHLRTGLAQARAKTGSLPQQQAKELTLHDALQP